MKLKDILLEQDTDTEIDDLIGDLESSIQNAAALVNKRQNEAAFTTALGLILSGPFLIKMIGKVVQKVQQKITGSSNAGDAIIEFSEKAHHALEKPFKMLAKTFTNDPKKQSMFAQVMIAGILAILLIDSGLGFAKYAKQLNIKSSLLYGAKSAIKSTELRAMIPELGQFVRNIMTKV